MVAGVCNDTIQYPFNPCSLYASLVSIMPKTVTQALNTKEELISICVIYIHIYNIYILRSKVENVHLVEP